MSHERFVSLLDCVADLRAEGTLPIDITFDDGNVSDLSIALPELSKRQLPATFFLCSGRLQSRNYLDAGAARELVAAGMGIGSHGMHHRDWRMLDEAELIDEISLARRELEDACGLPITKVAIPFGSYDRRVIGKVRAEGFSHVYTSDGGLAYRRAWLKPRNTLGVNSEKADIENLLSQPWTRQLVRDVARSYKMLR
ncbi:MAG TPA: polysaccharide deacetylase family protein [Hyphomicrobiaceae bacterium]|jgi:peptidoglycan/xylan/chitin deacetylase (PgdA/CDA1 family)|nr:polysaccharide deacetylase family protein [Hyphomicrobiaceae bacterium]